MKKKLIAVLLAIVALLGGYTGYSSLKGSAADGNYATTTSTGRFTALSLLRSGPGILNGVTVTGAAAGVVNFYDATTSSALLRASSQSTSTILIANLPASLVAGNYPFEINFSRGLLVDIIGTIPTTTITWK